MSRDPLHILNTKVNKRSLLTLESFLVREPDDDLCRGLLLIDLASVPLSLLFSYPALKYLSELLLHRCGTSAECLVGCRLSMAMKLYAIAVDILNVISQIVRTMNQSRIAHIVF